MSEPTEEETAMAEGKGLTTTDREPLQIEASFEDLWLVGTRVYSGDRFVEVKPFERDALDRILDVTEPYPEFPPHMFVSATNSKYTQRLDVLGDFARELARSGEFADVKLEARPSALGLPQTVAYSHPRTGVRTEFDGLLFVSERKLHSGTLTLDETLGYARKQGYSYERAGQLPSDPHPLAQHFDPATEAWSHWRYVTGSMHVGGTCKRRSPDFQHLTLAVKMTDSNIHFVTCPTGDATTGRDFHVLFGQKEHIRQVLAHDAECGRYLRFMHGRVFAIRSDIVRIRRELLNSSPLIPNGVWQFFNPVRWTRAVRYWTHAHKSMEDLNRARTYLAAFAPFAQVYKDFAASGIAFYNLSSPNLGAEGLSQYQTSAPIMAEVADGSLVVARPLSSFNTYERLPAWVMDLVQKTDVHARDAYEMMQGIVSTSELQAVVVSATISIAVLAVTMLALALTAVGLFHYK